MSSGAVNPFDFAQAWDVISIGRTACPGICKISGFKRAHEWDVKKGKGSFGASITFIQRPPAKGSVTFSLWTALHFSQWDVFRPLLKYDPTHKAVQAVDIYHPSLADIDITSVVTESIGAIEHQGDQLYTITVDFLEYFPPPKKSAIGSPTGSAAAAGKPGQSGIGSTGDAAADAQQKEIAKLLAQAQGP